MYQQNKSSVSKVKFRQACKPCKRVLEAAKLAYTNKTKEPKFGSQKVLSSASDKERLFAENFSKNSNLNDSGISLPVFLSRTNLKLYNISVNPKMVKRVTMSLDLPQMSSPDCILVVVLKDCEPELSYIQAELSGEVLFSRLLEGFISGPYIKECWEKVYS